MHNCRTRRQKSGTVKAHANGSLHNGFEYHGTNVSVMLGQEALERGNVTFLKGFVKRGLGGIGKQVRGKHIVKPMVHAIDWITHAHGGKGIPMITGADRQKARLGP